MSEVVHPAWCDRNECVRDRELDGTVYVHHRVAVPAGSHDVAVVRVDHLTVDGQVIGPVDVVRGGAVFHTVGEAAVLGAAYVAAARIGGARG